MCECTHACVACQSCISQFPPGPPRSKNLDTPLIFRLMNENVFALHGRASSQTYHQMMTQHLTIYYLHINAQKAPKTLVL